MALLLTDAGRRDWPDFEIARIPLRGEPLDRAALPRRVPAFEQDDAALLVDDMRDLDAGEPLLQRFHLGVIIAVEFLATFEMLQVYRHAFPLTARRLGREGKNEVNLVGDWDNMPSFQRKLESLFSLCSRRK